MRIFNRRREPETRTEQAPNAEHRSYTSARIQSADDAVSGKSIGNIKQTAAAQTAAMLWGRAMAVGEVSPSTARTRVLTASVLYEMARQFVLNGQSVWLLDASTAQGVTLRQASDWDVHGVLDWRYRLTLSGPDGTVVRRTSSGGVLHPRLNVDPAQPHRGISPLDLPTTTTKILSALETSLGREAGGLVGYVLPAPIEGLSDNDTTELENDIKALAGGTAMVPTMRRGFGEGAAGAPTGADWKPNRIGPNPPAAEVALRNDVARSILSACGVPPVLVGGISGDAAAQRESWRQFLHGTIQPVADILAVEMSEKMEVPISLGFDRLFASDVQGRARAFQSLTGGGMTPARASELTGLSG